MTRSTFRNWHVEAYLEGKTDEIPAEALEAVKKAAEARKVEGPKKSEPKKSQKETTPGDK